MEEHPQSTGKTAAAVAWAGLALGPLASFAVWFLLPGPEAGLSLAGRATASVATLMAIYWTTEALPLPVTALLPLVLFPAAGVFPSGEGFPSQIRQAAMPYGHEFIFLFMGGFMIALAVERWGLHRRVALTSVLALGTQPARVIAGAMGATALLSMWLSNTATTVMMLPIGVSLSRLARERESADCAVDPTSGKPMVSQGESYFGIAMMLGIAYAASIGGLGTLIGTPPNLFLAGYLKEAYGIEIGFGRWMAAALPLVVVFLAIAWFVVTRIAFPVGRSKLSGGRDFIRGELRALGPLSRGEWTVLCVFLATALFWILREPLAQWEAFVGYFPFWVRLHDTSIALCGAGLLFVIPVDLKRRTFALDWETAQKLPWGVLILFGGGLSLASAVSASGLATWICEQLPLDIPPWGLVVLVTVTVIFLTEVTSNTATASVFLPLLGGIATGMGLDPRFLAVPAALAASCAFMLPVATPPNAIVFGSGQVRIAHMVKAGLLLNVIGSLLIPAALYTLLGWVLGFAGP